jgi:putative CocE/NonD family hydrolase
MLHFAAGNALAEEAGEPAEDLYRVDFTTGTGGLTRYGRLAALEIADYYTDWQGRHDRMLCYETAPLAEAAEIAGHPVVDIELVPDKGDAVLHVYLSEVEADGTIRYVTEGMLRAIHRRETQPPANQKWTWPFRDYTRANAEPLKPGEPARLRFALLPIAWTFRPGSRIRLSISGADCDHYVQLPHGRPPVLAVRRGGESGSLLELPWRTSGDASFEQREMQ